MKRFLAWTVIALLLVGCGGTPSFPDRDWREIARQRERREALERQRRAQEEKTAAEQAERAERLRQRQFAEAERRKSGRINELLKSIRKEN